MHSHCCCFSFPPTDALLRCSCSDLLQGMLYYYSTKEGSRREQAPRNTVSLLTSTIKPDAEVCVLGCEESMCKAVWSPSGLPASTPA